MLTGIYTVATALSNPLSSRSIPLRFLWRVASDRYKSGQGPPEAEAQARGLFGTFQNQIIAAKHGSNVPVCFDQRVCTDVNKSCVRRLVWAPSDGRLIRPVDVPTEARVTSIGRALKRKLWCVT